MSQIPNLPSVPNSALSQGVPVHLPRKLKLATVSLAGCFGCHMSFLDIDERLLQLLELVEFDRSPLTDIKQIGRLRHWPDRGWLVQR
jgi:hypothetical protein